MNIFNEYTEATRNATMNAMDTQRPFSWLSNREVQEGAYIRHTQHVFHIYKMPRLLLGKFA
ncbi:hypothetical protein CNR33_00024 [Pseudomonas phage tabernarius]|uniref:Uncharacterized protein n=1 Tax=Pseudomonas phage tabernarius TaxID=2048978 RepID=A0A2H4P768_9CAUD|nr:hypothetical protein FDJ17_gp24 [Pseudomonas phage tabernarius]ATW57870.1 hypothetical protein CNR33_00024 [Pseudomonas phage tabernarius]